MASMIQHTGGIGGEKYAYSPGLLDQVVRQVWIPVDVSSSLLGLFFSGYTLGNIGFKIFALFTMKPVLLLSLDG